MLETKGDSALIVKVTIVVITLFFVAPLIPGTGCAAARGTSTVLALMISFVSI